MHAAPDSTSTLAVNFQNPPLAARPGAFWPWLNANTDPARLKYDLQQMKANGMSGAEIWDVQALRNTKTIPAGPAFLSPESVKRIRFALNEAKKLGLRMGLITSSGWNAGGSWVDPDWACKMLVHSSVTTTGPVRFHAKLPFPEIPKGCPIGPDGLPVYYNDIAVLAVPIVEEASRLLQSADKTIPNKRRDASSTLIHPGPADIIDLTDRLTSGGVLTWDAPPGPWRIIRFTCTNTGQRLIVPSPNSDGLFIDFLSPAATRRHLQIIMDRLGITPQNAADSGLDYMEVDSMELHKGNPWTDDFAQWFQKTRGYSPTKWLPALAGETVRSKAASDAFLYDYHRAVSDLLIHSHYETGSAFLEQYGMQLVAEAGGPGPPIWDTCPVDALKALGAVDIPRGEFWMRHKNIFLIKEIASAAHTYGLPIVDAESFTTWERFNISPFELKLSADRAFAEGLNHITIHTFAHSPDAAGLPGWVYHAGIDINPNSTWWPFVRPFMDYLARCSAMLQQGNPVADVLWYYGDQAPNFFPAHHHVPEKPRLPGLSHGYDYDIVNSEVILNRLTMENGRFVLPEGTSYRILAFPDDAAMPLAVLKKLEAFAKQGGIIVGNPPKRIPGLHKVEEASRLLPGMVSALWGKRRDASSTITAAAAAAPATTNSQGRVYPLQPLDDILAAEGIPPDFSVEGATENPPIDYIHRRTTNTDIYFIRNTTLQTQTPRLHLRTKKGAPQQWDPATGDTRPCQFSHTTTGTAINLHLPPGGSTFIVIPQNTMDNNTPETTRNPRISNSTIQETARPLNSTTPWTITFPPNLGAPTSTTTQNLKSLTEFDNPGIRYFSGIAQYQTTFHYDPPATSPTQKIYLDLGEIPFVAQVTANNTTAGITWKPPYRVDITNHIKPGNNTLIVQTAIPWHNRLLGDALLPADQRITKTNLPLPNKDKAKPLKSGLIGPVQLVTIASP